MSGRESLKPAGAPMIMKDLEVECRRMAESGQV